MRYFTDSPFERLMMEKPCGHSRAAEAAWCDEERKKREKEKNRSQKEAVARAAASKR